MTNNYELGKYMLAMMKHAINEGKRNYYCAGVDSQESGLWDILCGIGIAKKGPLINEGRDRYYHLTHQGIRFLINDR